MMHAEHLRGVLKRYIELKYRGKTVSHGKLFSSPVKRYLCHDTEHTHPLALEVERLRDENRRLRALLQRHDINPEG